MTVQPWLKKSTRPTPRNSILALAPDVDEAIPRRLDLITFSLRRQSSTKQAPRNAMYNCLAVDPEVDELMVSITFE